MNNVLTYEEFLKYLNKNFKDLRIYQDRLEFKKFWWTDIIKKNIDINKIIDYIGKIIEESKLNINRFDTNKNRKQIYFSFFIPKK